MMQFDVIKEKERDKPKLKGKNKKIQKEITKLNKIYPVIGYTEEGFIKTKIGFNEAIFEIFEVKKYDLFLMDDQEFNYVTDTNWDMLRKYSYAIKEVYMNFPEDNQEQQEYFNFKIKQSTSPIQIQLLQTELDKLKYIEKNYKMRDIYLFVYAPNQEELMKRIGYLQKFNGILELKKISIEKKSKILNRMNNKY